MLLSYLAVLMMLGFVVVIASVILLVSRVLGAKKRSREKLTPWECGMEPVGEANKGHFRVHFFIIAVLFVVFDVETLFLFPWAVILTDKSISTLVFAEMVIFIAVLAVGLVYAWAKGALEWI
jgi:NADH-quinone oxidoreductase subunit A